MVFPCRLPRESVHVTYKKEENILVCSLQTDPPPRYNTLTCYVLSVVEIKTKVVTK